MSKQIKTFRAAQPKPSIHPYALTRPALTRPDPPRLAPLNLNHNHPSIYPPVYPTFLLCLCLCPCPCPCLCLWFALLLVCHVWTCYSSLRLPLMMDLQEAVANAVLNSRRNFRSSRKNRRMKPQVTLSRAARRTPVTVRAATAAGQRTPSCRTRLWYNTNSNTPDLLLCWAHSRTESMMISFPSSQTSSEVVSHVRECLFCSCVLSLKCSELWKN